MRTTKAQSRRPSSSRVQTLTKLFSREQSSRWLLGDDELRRVLGRRDVRPGARARAAPDLQFLDGRPPRRPKRRTVPAGLETHQGRRWADATAPDTCDPRAIWCVARDKTSSDVIVDVERVDDELVLMNWPRREPTACRGTRRTPSVYYFAPPRSTSPPDGGLSLSADDYSGAGRSARSRTTASWNTRLLSALDRARRFRSRTRPATHRRRSATLVLLAEESRMNEIYQPQRPGRLCRAHDRILDPSTTRRRRRSTRRHSSPTRPSARWSSAPWTSTKRSTPPRWPRRCARTDRRRRAVPQARPEPAAGGDVPAVETRTSRPSRAHRLRRRASVTLEAGAAGRGPPRAGRRGRPARPRHRPCRGRWSRRSSRSRVTTILELAPGFRETG